MSSERLVRGLGEWLLSPGPETPLSVAVFGSDDAERGRFLDEVRGVVALDGRRAAVVDVDLAARPERWVWSEVIEGVTEGLGAALVAHGGAGPGSPAHKVFNDLKITERAIQATRQAADRARQRLPEVEAVRDAAAEALRIAVHRREELERPGSAVVAEFVADDRVLARLMDRVGVLAVLLRVETAGPHGLADLLARARGPHRHLLRAARFAMHTGGLSRLLLTFAALCAGVLAWEGLPVATWLGDAALAIPHRTLAAAFAAGAAVVVLWPGIKRSRLLVELVRAAGERWEGAVLKAGRERLSGEVDAARAAFGAAEDRLAAVRLLVDGEEEKVRTLRAGPGVGRFSGSTLGNRQNMERWARAFDAARTDLQEAARRFAGLAPRPFDRLVVVLRALGPRLQGEPADTLGILRFAASLPAISAIGETDPRSLREAAKAQQPDKSRERSLVFMAGDAKDFAVPLPPQDALDRSFHLGVLTPRSRDSAMPSLPGMTLPPMTSGVWAAAPAPPAPAAVESARRALAAMTGLTPGPHAQFRTFAALRLVRLLVPAADRAALDGQAATNGAGQPSRPFADLEAALLVAALLLADPDRAREALRALADTPRDTLREFIEQDLRAIAAQGGDPGGWQGLCRKLLQARDLLPGAESVERLRRWAGPVSRAVAGSLPLVAPID